MFNILWRFLHLSIERFRPFKEVDRDPKCTFCNVEALPVVLENESMVAFHDHRPRAKEHLLVIPRKHIRSVRGLRKDDVQLVKELHEFGIAALESLGASPKSHIFGFHIPPFNSVDHLHLHAFSAPFINNIARKKYPISKRKGGKGISWFVEVRQAIEILEKGSSIGIFRC